MAICKRCNLSMDWGAFSGKWVPLVPISDDEGLPRTYVDQNGVLRAEHKLVCDGIGCGDTVSITKLAEPIIP